MCEEWIRWDLDTFMLLQAHALMHELSQIILNKARK